MTMQTLDTIIHTFMDNLPPGLTELRHDIKKHLRWSIQNSLHTMQLVPRDEFDAQARVLSRLRAQLAELEKKVDALTYENTPPLQPFEKKRPLDEDM